MTTELVRGFLPGALAGARQDEQDALGSEDGWVRADAVAGIWLRSARFAGGTREQYAAVYQSWTQWCLATGITPFEAKRPDVLAYTEALAKVGNPAAQRPRPLAKRSIARHMAALSSFYREAIEEEVIERNPVPLRNRPKVSSRQQPHQPHLSRDENRALIAAADADGPRSAALVALLLLACLRISEALGARVEDMAYERGRTLVRVRRKGGEDQKVLLAPEAAQRVRGAIGNRRTGFIIETASGKAVDRKAAWQTIRRLGREAGIPVPIGPHTLRHAYITRGHELQIPLADLQDAAGHEDPKTTRLYDRSGLDEDRHPSYRIARDLAGADEAPPSNTGGREVEESHIWPRD